MMMRKRHSAKWECLLKEVCLMGIYVDPGNENFRSALKSEIYIDKTGLLSYTDSVIGTEQRCICVSRPRRLGKSIAADMKYAEALKEYTGNLLLVGINYDRSTKKHFCVIEEWKK